MLASLASLLPMKSIIFIAMISFAVHSSAALQTECTEIDLRDQFGEVRNQGDTSWCYAEASADLLTGFFKTRTLGTMSAFQLAMIYNYAFEGSLNSQGGNMADTLKTSLRRPRETDSEDERLKFGFCPNALGFETGGGMSLASKISRLQELKKIFDLSKSDPEAQNKFSSLSKTYLARGGMLSQITEIQIVNALEKSNPGNFLLRFADLICRNRVYNTDLNINVVSHLKTVEGTLVPIHGPSCDEKVDFDLLPDIHREISNHNAVAVGYSSALITPRMNLDAISAGHAGVIVGRRWDSGSCQLLIRNSWGSECSTTGPGEKSVSRYSSRVQLCEQGNLWVKEEDLAKTLNSAIYLLRGEDAFPQLLSPKLTCR